MTQSNHKKVFCNKLAMEIFSRSYDELDQLHKEFISFQITEYNKYRKKVRAAGVAAKEAKKLSSYEYSIIDDFFFRRVPLRCVLNGIKQGIKSAEHYKVPIFSIGFFRPFIHTEFKKYKVQTLGNLKDRYRDCKLDSWLFLIYKEVKEGKMGKMKFDPFYGYYRNE
jgi:hypothetical protein